MKKKFIKITAFALVLVLLLIGFHSVFSFKYLDSSYKMKMFYEQEENTVDVLVLGSSHAYQGINTAVLWKEYGFAAYDLCGASQQIWNTYYYLEEALKTQTPKVIILDTFMLYVSGDYGETSFAIKNTYGMKWSETKTAAIRASFDYETVGMQYYFDILQYHSRYSDLDKTDFYPYMANKDMYANHKGFYCYFYSTEIPENDVSLMSYRSEMTEKVEEYYRKILELAQSRHIPILVTAIPFNVENFHQGYFNTAKDIAENEYNIPFYNFNTDYKEALGLDYTMDFSDKQHLNYLGSTKLTRFFGDLLQSEYDVPDRRGDENYLSWDLDAEVYYHQLENAQVASIPTLLEYTDVFSNERYTVILTENFGESRQMPSGLQKTMAPFFNLLNIPEEEYTAGGVWIFENGQKAYYHSGSGGHFSKSVPLGRFDDALVAAQEKTFGEQIGTAFSLYMNKEEKTVVDKGVNIYVYDTFTQSTVDCLGFSYEDGQLKR